MIPFRYIATGTFVFFMGLLLLVVVVAYTKKNSGVTGMDMSEVHKLRIPQKAEG